MFIFSAAKQVGENERKGVVVVYLFISVGEAESPGVVDEEEVGVLIHGVRGEEEPPLTSFLLLLAGLDLEEGPTIEGLR